MAVFVAAKFGPAGDTEGMAKDRAVVILRWLPVAGLPGHKRAEGEDKVIKKPP